MADGQECRATDDKLASYTKHLGLQVKYQQCSNNDRLCSGIGLTESSNMLHYSNASSREKSRRYLVIKRGLAWLLWQEGGVVNTAVDRGTSCSVGLGVYRREGGGRNSKYIASKCITGQQAELDAF